MQFYNCRPSGDAVRTTTFILLHCQLLSTRPFDAAQLSTAVTSTIEFLPLSCFRCYQQDFFRSTQLFQMLSTRPLSFHSVVSCSERRNQVKKPNRTTTLILLSSRLASVTLVTPAFRKGRQTDDVHSQCGWKITVKLATSIFIIVGKLVSSKHTEEAFVRRREARMGFRARLDTDLNCCQVRRVEFHYCRRGWLDCHVRSLRCMRNYPAYKVFCSDLFCFLTNLCNVVLLISFKVVMLCDLASIPVGTCQVFALYLVPIKVDFLNPPVVVVVLLLQQTLTHCPPAFFPGHRHQGQRKSEHPDLI